MVKFGVVAESCTLSNWNEPLPASPAAMSVTKTTRTVCPAKDERSTVTGVLAVWKTKLFGVAVRIVCESRSAPPPAGCTAKRNTRSAAAPKVCHAAR